MCLIHHISLCLVYYFFFYGFGDHRDLHVLTHSFPTRRASDLSACPASHSACWSCSPRRRWPPRRPARNPRRSRGRRPTTARSEEHTSELQSLMRNSYAAFCLKKKTNKTNKIIQYLESHVSTLLTTAQFIYTLTLKITKI